MFDRKYKGKESPFFNKAQRVILRNGGNIVDVAFDLIKMKNGWENNPIPFYIYLNATDDLGRFKQDTYSTSNIKINESINVLAGEKRSDIFYEKLLGYILKGHQHYSHKEFRNLRELNASITEHDLVMAGRLISKAIMMNPSFEVYLDGVSTSLNPALQDIIKNSKENQLTVYSKFFAIKNSNLYVFPSVVLNNFKSKEMSAEEKVLFALAKDVYVEEKLTSKKGVEVSNKVIGELIKLRPDIAISLVNPDVFMKSSSSDVKEAFVDLLFSDVKRRVNGSVGFLNSTLASEKVHENATLINVLVNLTKSLKRDSALADMLLMIKEYDSKQLPVVIKTFKSIANHSGINEGVAAQLKDKMGGFDKAFIEIYRDTHLLKSYTKNLKNIPNHLKIESFFSPDLSKQDLLNENVSKVKVNDITKEMASSSEFWITYIEKFKTNVQYSPLISKKLELVKGEKSVVDALLASKEPAAAVYLLSGKFIDIEQKEIEKNFIEKTKINPRTVLFTPLEKLHLVPDEATVISVNSFRSLNQQDNAVTVMMGSKLFKQHQETLQMKMVDNFLTVTEVVKEKSKRKGM